MAEWGLDGQLRDFRAVVDQARATTPNVFLGGHSLGAALAQMFAAYDFGDTAGFQLIKGLIILDATADPTGLGIPAISDEVYFNGGEGPLGPVVGLNQLRNPTAPEHTPFLVQSPFSPTWFQLLEIGAQLALVDPTGPSVLREAMPALVPVPATNAAAFALNVDDEFQNLVSARFSIGFLSIPPGGSATGVATRMDDPAKTNPNGLWAPKDLSPALQQWAPLKDLSSLGREFKSGPETSDFDTVAQAFLLGAGNQTAALGDTNLVEWYPPNRLLTDMVKVADLGRRPLSAPVIAAQTARGGNPLTLTENRRVNVPLLAVRNSEGGIVPNNLAFQLYVRSTSIRKVTIAVMENYTHVDVLTSLEKRSSPGGKNLPELIVDFLEENL
jgi:pimeloyl-ACP methyl ester carboxylesterase